MQILAKCIFTSAKNHHFLSIQQGAFHVVFWPFKRKFGNHGLTLRARPTADSVEVLLNSEFLGVIYKDEDDGEVSYDFNMAILGIDVNE